MVIMRRRSIRIIKLVIIAFLLIAIFVLGYFRGSLSPTLTRVVIPLPLGSPAASPSAPVSPVNYRIEEVVSSLSVPWSIVFTSPSRMLVTERPGNIRIIENGELVSSPLINFPETVSKAEEGSMGLALHPNYSLNKHIYVSLAYESGGNTYIKVERIVDAGKTAVRDKVIIDKIPAATLHAGSRIKFGPDGMLYITSGDATKKELAQDKSSLAGKILRITGEGGIPQDNPTTASPVYSYGHRNPQGIDWHPQTGNLYSTEHGPSGFDGQGGGDELNLIQKGMSYGWPIVSHQRSAQGHVSPLVVWTPAVAPASATFYRGSVFPQFTNDLFFGGLVGEGLFRVTLDSFGKNVVSWEKLPDINYGRIREVVSGPDGFIYFSTSNTDGRGRIRSGDDKIFRLVPLN